MNHTAREIARETGNNPSAQYFEFDPVTFASQRITGIMTDWTPRGEGAIILSVHNLGRNGFLTTDFTALYGEQIDPEWVEELRTNMSAETDVEIRKKLLGCPNAVNVHVYNNKGTGFVEISTSPEFAATRKYRSLVGRLADPSSKVMLDGPVLEAVGVAYEAFQVIRSKR